jgi:hypothetical protein
MVGPPAWPSLKEGEAISISAQSQSLLMGLNVSKTTIEVKICCQCERRSVRCCKGAQRPLRCPSGLASSYTVAISRWQCLFLYRYESMLGAGEGEVP